MTLKELRISKGFSQQNVANLLKMPLRTYKRFELDKAYENSYKYKAIFNTLKSIEKKHKKATENLYKKLCVVGGGHVGLSVAKVLAKKYSVQVVDIDKNKVSYINNLNNKNMIGINSLKETSKFEVAIICLPTNYDEKTKTYDTREIQSTIQTISKIYPSALVVIKSTVAIGFTEKLESKNEIIYAPEFLREKTAFEDAQNPDRLIIGCKKVTAKTYKYASTVESVISIPRKTIFMSYKEAEAVKLYSNAYLAMRIAFFNDLDTKAFQENINTKKVIKAIGLDPRIGDYYNNPSFFYSGYCLPKDAKALSNQCNSDILNAIVSSNEKRKKFIVKTIIEEAMTKNSNPVIGIYNLDTEGDGGKSHVSSSFEIFEILQKYPVKVVVFDENYKNSIKDFEEFCNTSDLIITNVFDDKLYEVRNKVFTRNLI